MRATCNALLDLIIIIALGKLQDSSERERTILFNDAGSIDVPVASVVDTMG
jgi:hypothetical protein